MDFSKAVICFTGRLTEPCTLKHRAQALGAKVLSKLPEPITGLDYYLVYGASPAFEVTREARKREMTLLNLPYFEDELTRAERPTLDKSRHRQLAETLDNFGLALSKVADNELNRGKTPVRCLLEILEAHGPLTNCVIGGAPEGKEGVDYQNIDLKGPAPTQHWARLWARDIQQWVQVRQHDVEGIERIVKAAPPEGAVVAYANLENGKYTFFDENDRAHVGLSQYWIDLDARSLAAWKQLHRIPLTTDEWKYDDLTEAQRRVAHDVMTSLANEFEVSWSAVETAARGFRFHGPQDFADKLRARLANPVCVGDGCESLSPEGTEPLLKGERMLTEKDARRIDDAVIPSLDPDSYNDWLLMGSLLHATYGGSDKGLKAWHEFSKQSFKYCADHVNSRWATFELPRAGDAYAQMAETLKGVDYECQVPPEARYAGKVARIGLGFGKNASVHKLELQDDPDSSAALGMSFKTARYAPKYQFADEETAGQWEHQAMQEFREAAQYIAHPYHSLANVLLDAFEQAAMGKGKERHANDLPFTEQKMQTICKAQGHLGGLIYQISKKALEAEKMSPEKRIHELGGVIVYAAGAIIFTQEQEKQS